MLVGAVVLDVLVGEPPPGSTLEKIHPVVLMGRLIGWMDRRISRGSPTRELILGILLILVTMAVFVIPTVAFILVSHGQGIPYLVVGTLVLKSCFTFSGLRRFALDTLVPNLGERRRRTARIVSRKTEDLGFDGLNSATIESVAENFTDSFFSPLMYFALLGLPGAMAYRVVNTADAMIGYRDPDHVYVGKATARLDTLLNWPWERLAAALILLTSRSRAPSRDVTLDRQPPRTIVAMARVLGVSLWRPGSYTVNQGSRSPGDEDVRRALGIIRRAAALVLPLLLCALLVMPQGGWDWFALVR